MREGERGDARAAATAAGAPEKESLLSPGERRGADGSDLSPSLFAPSHARYQRQWAVARVFRRQSILSRSSTATALARKTTGEK